MTYKNVCLFKLVRERKRAGKVERLNERGGGEGRERYVPSNTGWLECTDRATL